MLQTLVGLDQEKTESTNSVSFNLITSIMTTILTFAQASKAGRELRSSSSNAPVKSNAGYILATWRWQQLANAM
ncbi:hypothetical protein NIES2135_27040 [Leptolyngbya boryana NIES-2135]|uniref:Uncharacterized protein n=1 Tax=Leptolyngbya boryana NIES-2135 TaxID=1973484 RepID=A0A1Z4JGK7_LEPBY|nr:MULTISPECIES: hypothetical protein [Leptolyngbya]BAY55879.1 hypothetical protein NIES2135_27040 [Leptolyngbya boryana NIES-2135]MBD2368815.1 hypothetical protein [Leptolyngbya sp. FACHB-161]MBD2375317.1 hypothetical protein [Leptolyngbya sp. FACHB-238]MBD2399735.1 hypothetical protein [Leptolyngbya sp. FACHB-239]MBD2405941.1 hypothetical protein [Leptolyngbya sp. FACHB-402]